MRATAFMAAGLGFFAAATLSVDAGEPAKPSQHTTVISGRIVGPPNTAKAVVGPAIDDSVRRAWSAHAGLPLYVTAAPNAEFRIAIPQSLRSVALVVRSPGFARLQSARIELSSPTRKIGDLTLVRGLTIRGRVIDDVRAPVANARIVVIEAKDPTDPLPDWVKPSGKSAATGQFSLAGLNPGLVDLRVEREGYAPRLLRRIDSTRLLQPLDIELSPAVFLAGVVVDHQDRPVNAAAVSATWDGGSNANAITSEEGLFKVGPFARGTRVSLYAKANGFVPAHSDDFFPPNDQIRLLLDSNGSLSGKVTDARSGEPIEFFKVIFRRRPTAPLVTAEHPGSREFHSSVGRFDWPDVLAGTWTIAIAAPGYQVKRFEGVRIPQGGNKVIEAKLDRGYSIAGYIRNETTGEPIASATVSEKVFATRTRALEVVRSVQTSGDGSFRLDGLPPRHVMLRIVAAGYLPEEHDIAPREQELADFALSSGGAVSGSLFASDGATPITGLVRLENLAGASAIAASTDAVGHFAFEMVPDGHYRISGESEQGITPPKKLILAKGQRLEGVALKLRDGATIYGEVSGLIAGERGRVQITIDGKEYSRTTSIDENGNYSVSGVPSGPVTIVAKTPLDREMSRAAKVVDREGLNVRFEFPDGVRLSGNVRRAGSPMRFVALSASPLSGQTVSSAAETNHAGQYAFEGLPKGRYSIRTGEGQAREIDLISDATLDFDLPSLVASGRIVDAITGEPMAGVAVTLRDRRQAVEPRQGVSDYVGNFSIVGIAAGTLELTAFKSQYELWSQSISIDSNVTGLKIAMQRETPARIRVRDAVTDQPLRQIIVSQRRPQEAQPRRYTLELDEHGVGSLPRAMTGDTLTFFTFGYGHQTIPSWDGNELEIRLATN